MSGEARKRACPAILRSKALFWRLGSYRPTVRYCGSRGREQSGTLPRERTTEDVCHK